MKHVLCLGLAWIACMAAAPAARAAKHALLVGVNTYSNYPQFDLEGCENDVRVMADLLQRKFQFPAENTTILLSKEATAEGIRQAFRKHLIEATKPGDVAVFYYSGHGAQIADEDGDETEDKKDEILCPSDILRSDEGKIVNIVVDDEIGRWIQELKGREFVAILDCCHSGTGMKSLGMLGGKSRYMPVDALGPKGVVEPPATRALPEVTPTGEVWHRDLQGGDEEYVTLISACQSDEKAREAEFTINGETSAHGALTVKLLKGLGENGLLNQDGRLTYADLKKYLMEPLRTENDVQHPQFESSAKELNRDVFHGQDERIADAPAGGGYGVQVALDRPQPAPMAPLKIWIGAYSDMAAGEASGPSEAAAQLSAALGAFQFLRADGGPREFDAAVFYDPNPGGGWIVGTMLRSGAISQRLTVPAIAAASIQPIMAELTRLYLVRGLERLENPDSPIKVNIELVSGARLLRKGELIAFRVLSSADGYLTVFNIDCEGGVHQLFPNEYDSDNFIRGGQTIVLPSPEHFDLEVIEPAGREFVQAIVTSKPLRIPVIDRQSELGGFRSVSSPQEAEELVGFLHKAIGAKQSSNPSGAAKPSPDAQTIDSLKPDEWGADSLVFFTAQ
ncbi:MAG: Caspase domain protein [candidate division BRC1 bacterium ADurb.BinA364]|nr:MAG: Caspase domain protein [candidate division BRC1 bacterium ADurb.BinA364]